MIENRLSKKIQFDNQSKLINYMIFFFFLSVVIHSIVEVYSQ